MSIEWPKWPLLLVDGERISPEQADQVIIRTTWLEGAHGPDEQWNKAIRHAFGVRIPAYRNWYLRNRRRTPTNDNYWEMESTQWDTAAQRLGVLPLNYMHNDRIATTYCDGPHGWCEWGGLVRSYGMGLTCKWPTLGEVDEEWRMIAGAFPFLSLKAQLVKTEWDFEAGVITGYTPLVTWIVHGGVAALHAEPGPLILQPRESDPENWRLPPAREVDIRRLRSAIRRCGPKVKGARHC